MLIINYIFAISATFAFTDYFANVTDLTARLNKGEIEEVFEPAIAQQVFNSDEIQVISVAVHGGKVEAQTEVLAKKLYDKVVDTRGKSVLYSFLSNINSAQSGDYYTGRCIPIHCCKKIKNTIGKETDNKQNYKDGSICKNFKVEEKFKGQLTEQNVCKYNDVCYLNAGHVTSKNFTTEKLNELLPCRYPVSFHGFQNRNDDNGSLVDVVLGGLSKQKYGLAKSYHKATEGKIRIAVCRSGKKCRVYDPKNKSFEQGTSLNGSGLTGTSKDNFVNLGEHKCGLQLELSTIFRKFEGEKRKYWECLIQSILDTLPNRGEEVCDDKKLFDNDSIDTDDEFP
jgi:phage replication-related protein YjqB (UPF0714/DUF867 family)